VLWTTFVIFALYLAIAALICGSSSEVAMPCGISRNGASSPINCAVIHAAQESGDVAALAQALRPVNDIARSSC
jgi:hypothetical protein